ARFLVRLHTGVEILCTTWINETRRAVLEEFGNPQERSIVLVLLGHCALQGEHAREVDHWIEIIWKDAAGCMRIADVHMVVAKAWRHHHLTRVDHPVSGDMLQGCRLTHLNDALPLDEDRAILDNATLRVNCHDEAGPVDFEGSHRSYL